MRIRNKIAALACSLCIQATANAQASDTLSVHYKVFRQAMNSGDASLAVSSLNYLIAEKPGTVYRDSLAMIYMGIQQPAIALYWINQRITESPANLVGLKEMQAQCLSAIGNAPAAITVLEELSRAYPGNTTYLWQLANAQSGIRRQAEALITLQKIAELPADSSKAVSYLADATTHDVKYTSIPAAAANLKGLILYEMKKNSEAREAFAQALKMDVSYTQPKQNLSAIMAEEQKDAKKLASKNKTGS